MSNGRPAKRSAYLSYAEFVEKREKRETKLKELGHSIRQAEREKLRRLLLERKESPSERLTPPSPSIYVEPMISPFRIIEISSTFFFKEPYIWKSPGIPKQKSGVALMPLKLDKKG